MLVTGDDVSGPSGGDVPATFGGPARAGRGARGGRRARGRARPAAPRRVAGPRRPSRRAGPGRRAASPRAARPRAGAGPGRARAVVRGPRGLHQPVPVSAGRRARALGLAPRGCARPRGRPARVRLEDALGAGRISSRHGMLHAQHIPAFSRDCRRSQYTPVRGKSCSARVIKLRCFFNH